MFREMGEAANVRQCGTFNKVVSFLNRLSAGLSLYYNSIILFTHKISNMNYVLIIHEVEDFSLWKKIFDEASKIRKEAGEISYQVLKYEKEANKVVHFSVWDSLNNAKKFFESPKLLQIRIDAGVRSPNFIYLEEVERGVL